MGIFAVQLIKGVSRIVILRSRSLGRVRVDMTAGTVHPKPMSMGTMLLPESPIFRSSLSMKKATLAMYPESSSMERKKNRVTIMGRKLSTPPTPANTPSMIRPWRTSFTPTEVNALSAAFVRALMPSSSHPCMVPPMTSKVSQDTRNIMRIKKGIAVHLPVRIRSIFSLLMLSLLFSGLLTKAEQIFVIKEYRISAMAALRSSFLSFSIWMTMCSMVSFSLSSSRSLSSTSLSPSITLLVANLRGTPASLA